MFRGKDTDKRLAGVQDDDIAEVDLTPSSLIGQRGDHVAQNAANSKTQMVSLQNEDTQGFPATRREPNSVFSGRLETVIDAVRLSKPPYSEEPDYGGASASSQLSQRRALSDILWRQQHGTSGLDAAAIASQLRSIGAENPPSIALSQTSSFRDPQSIQDLEIRRQLLFAAGLGPQSQLGARGLEGSHQLQRMLLSAGFPTGNDSVGSALGGALNPQAGQIALLHSMGLLGQGRGGLSLLGGGGLATFASQSASSVAPSMLQQQQAQLSLVREQLMRRSSMPSSNPLGMNFDPAVLFGAVNRGQHGADASSSLGGLATHVTPRSHGGSGAPAALLREQGLSGPEDVTSLSESFPVKLHRLMLDLELQDCGTDIASFLPNGIAFAVHNPDRFETEVMRKYFPRMNRFASFQRQLNLYDFRRITDGPAPRGAYYHPNFNRDFPVLCRAMKRTKIKGQING